jgi:hypothetical protein
MLANTNGAFATAQTSRKLRINPIAQEVQDVFDSIYGQVGDFIKNPQSAMNGIIVSGDAGTGKTFTVKKALMDNGHAKNVEYIKGGKITAASLYVKLYLNRAKHRIIVLDDCDIIHHQDKNAIVPMLLGAADLGQKRDVSWETARKNPLMEEYNVPHNFKFEGKIIWITNDRREQINKAVKQWAMALDSRFGFTKCYFTDEQKLMYTLHLVENADMLGVNCQEYEGGYPEDIINNALDYMSEHYRNLVEVTPRRAIMIADIMNQCSDPKQLKERLRQLWK